MACLLIHPTYVATLGALLLAASAPAATPSLSRRAPLQQAPGKAVAAQQTAPATAFAAATPHLSPTAGLTATTTAAAPQVVRLRGVVRNPDGQPCAGASVYPAGAPRQLVVTDAQGAFTLPVPAGSAVTLRVEYFGLGSSRVEVPNPTAEVLPITLGK